MNPDKGNGIVIRNKQKNFITMNEILDDGTKICELNTDEYQVEFKIRIILPSFESAIMFDSQVYQQMYGCAMGLLLAPILANAFMCHLKHQALVL